MFNKLFSTGKNILTNATQVCDKAMGSVRQFYINNEDEIKEKKEKVCDTALEYSKKAAVSIKDNATNICHNLKYSDNDIEELTKDIENQGGHYRELKSRKTFDTIFLGSESLASMLYAGRISSEVLEAYQAAYPVMAQEISFAEKVRELDSEGLLGFISGVKGKMFEQKYVEYLNDGNLPDGYTARLAESATQQGWDITIEGTNGEIASVLQAKATDSVSYVKEALETYPEIDVVTTDEVYSHLVMNGVGENIVNSSVSNAKLIDILEDSVDAASCTMDFTPPVLTLAFIAFTSYKDENLTLFEKSRSAGKRSGKAYLCYLLGSGVAAATGTWWLGVAGCIASRHLCDKGKVKYDAIDKLRKIKKNNQIILDRMKS